MDNLVRCAMTEVKSHRLGGLSSQSVLFCAWQDGISVWVDTVSPLPSFHSSGEQK
jgi:hypothetical protein